MPRAAKRTQQDRQKKSSAMAMAIIKGVDLN